MNKCHSYRVEKQGSFLALNIYALHRDESVWEDPFDFKPERFLDNDGKLANFDKMLVFGYGKSPSEFIHETG